MDLSDEEIVDLCYRKDGRINPNIFRKGYINDGTYETHEG